MSRSAKTSLSLCSIPLVTLEKQVLYKFWVMVASRSPGSFIPSSLGLTWRWRVRVVSIKGCFIFHHLKVKGKTIWHILLLYILRHLLPKSEYLDVI